MHNLLLASENARLQEKLQQADDRVTHLGQLVQDSVLDAEAVRAAHVHRAFYDGANAARKPTGNTTTAGSDFGSAHARHDIGTPATSGTGPTEVSANS